MEELLQQLTERISALPLAERVEALNAARRALRDVSPFRDEPVDLVEWIPVEDVRGNAYNPNTVAAPEMRLLELSISVDGFTQPVVTHATTDHLEVVDGFHRHLVAKRSTAVGTRTLGYLPVVKIRAGREALEDRMAATVRHNRARGKHGVTQMMSLVADLAKRNWSSEKIAKELGMDADEVLRLKQITGLAELFKEEEFSEAWTV